MHHRRIKRLFHSVFTKLLVTILIAGVAITATVLVSFSHIRFHSLSLLDRNLGLYTEYIVHDLGDPPDFDRANDIAERTGVAIRFEHPDGAWQTGKFPESVRLDRGWMRRQENNMWVGHHRGYFFMRLPHGGGELTFIASRVIRDHDNAGSILAAMAVVLLVIMGVAYFFIRRILKPLRALEGGVRALSAGRLDHRVTPHGNDEFRDLAEAFNSMAKRLAEQLASKEHLLLDMSHELRSPLTRMKVQLEFLSDEDAREALRAEVAEMEAMVTAILEEARLRSSVSSLSMETIDLAELIPAVALEFSERLPGVVCGEMKLPQIQIDREKIRMVLRNLLDNALKHTSDDGDPVSITAEQHNDRITIIVEDHGEGISEAALPHIFEPFFRADSSRSRKTGGYGLGLSLCKAIIEAHNGSIDITSGTERGTRAILKLPLS